MGKWIQRLPYLQRTRHGVFRYRRVVPPSLKAAAGKREILVSLRTKSVHLAEGRFIKAHAEAEAWLATLRANYIPHDYGVYFQAENAVIGLGARPPEGMEDPHLTDAGGGFVTAVPGAASIDSAMSFGLIRGGHLDMTVLGGLQVDERGYLANRIVPGKMVPGMGGAMDLVAGAKRVVVAMVHSAKGEAKIVPECTLPLTAMRRVSLIVTELAVIQPAHEGLLLRERGPDVRVEDILAQTSARLIIEDDVPEMRIG